MERGPASGWTPDTASVLTWFEANGRELPWRRTREPWAILVSELMLQQTQVARVIERWPLFLEHFPDPQRCADASVGRVIEAWAGLGYNRRAVNLHWAAVRIRDDHGGRLPRDLHDLLALPGIGPYTARAVRVFAFELDDAVVDTNVARIMARVSGRQLDRATVQQSADAAVPVGHGWAWNQALLDIGAGHCRARSTDCERCPLLGSALGNRNDSPVATDPAPGIPGRPFVGGCRWRGSDGPDPAIGSAGVSGRQSRFEGSDRQGRGRLVEALRQGPVAFDDLAEVMGWPQDTERVRRVVGSVERDGLAVRQGDGLVLPDEGRGEG